MKYDCEEHEETKVTLPVKVITYSGVAIGATIIFGMMFAPLLLPYIRNGLNNKYAKFTHKDKLVEEEMRKYRILVWILLPIGWGILALAYATYP
jgi:hypothetical protein